MELTIKTYHHRVVITNDQDERPTARISGHDNPTKWLKMSVQNAYVAGYGTIESDLGDNPSDRRVDAVLSTTRTLTGARVTQSDPPLLVIDVPVDGQSIPIREFTLELKQAVLDTFADAVDRLTEGNVSGSTTSDNHSDEQRLVNLLARCMYVDLTENLTMVWPEMSTTQKYDYYRSVHELYRISGHADRLVAHVRDVDRERSALSRAVERSKRLVDVATATVFDQDPPETPYETFCGCRSLGSELRSLASDGDPNTDHTVSALCDLLQINENCETVSKIAMRSDADAFRTR